MGNLIEYAKREFKIAGYMPVDEDQEDGPNKWIQENILELIKVFEKQNHSGSSASYCVNVFNKLARFEPLTDLTGKDDEWRDCGNGEFQNIRCSHVFKKDNQAYDSEGRIFIGQDGDSYINKDSFVLIDFPYMPIREYIHETEN